MTRARVAIKCGGLLLLLLQACSADRDTPVATRSSITDSAGVQIVENAAPQWQPDEEWRLSAEPILDIGTDIGDPDYEFGFAHGPVRLSDGRVVVADRQANEMRFYDAHGKFLTRAGRSGNGPGEFTQLWRLRKIDGDSLMALNPTSLTSIFTGSGKYVRRFELRQVPRRGNLWWLGRLSDGTLLAFSLQREGTRERLEADGRDLGHISVPPKPDSYRDTLLHFLFDMEGNLIDSIAKLPGQWLGNSNVFVPNAAYAFYENTFYHSPGDVVEIRQFRSLVGGQPTPIASTEGPAPRVRLERIVRRAPVRDLETTDSVKQEYLDFRRAQLERMAKRNPRGAPFQEAELNATKFPATTPAHQNRMYADATGNLWLQDYYFDPAKPTRWSVFDAQGRWLGEVQMPGNFTANEIGADYVLGISLDSLDAQRVRMYRLEKPAPGLRARR